MTYQNARFLTPDNAYVAVDIDGVPNSIPADESDRKYRKLIAAGVQIAPYQEPAPTKDDVNRVWDKRVFGGFTFNGKRFASDQDSIDNIGGAVTWAQQAISDGVEANNLYWTAADPNAPTQAELPFAWKAIDGTYMQMDAPTVVQFGIALARHKQAHFLAAQAIKSLDPIPVDFNSDARWP